MAGGGPVSGYNGLGPWWFPVVVRRILTAGFARLFDEASIEIHDAAYAKGVVPRAICDRGFRRAMQRDAARTGSDALAFVMDLIAWMLWVILRLFGWMSYAKNRA